MLGMKLGLSPLLDWAVAICLGMWILLFLPMCLSRRTRPWAAEGFILSSYITGFAGWIFSFTVAYQTLGGPWLFGMMIIASPWVAHFAHDYLFFCLSEEIEGLLCLLFPKYMNSGPIKVSGILQMVGILVFLWCVRASLSVFPLAVIGAVVQGVWPAIPSLLFATAITILPRCVGYYIPPSVA